MISAHFPAFQIGHDQRVGLSSTLIPVTCILGLDLIMSINLLPFQFDMDLDCMCGVIMLSCYRMPTVDVFCCYVGVQTVQCWCVQLYSESKASLDTRQTSPS